MSIFKQTAKEILKSLAAMPKHKKCEHFQAKCQRNFGKFGSNAKDLLPKKQGAWLQYCMRTHAAWAFRNPFRLGLTDFFLAVDLWHYCQTFQNFFGSLLENARISLALSKIFSNFFGSTAKKSKISLAVARIFWLNAKKKQWVPPKSLSKIILHLTHFRRARRREYLYSYAWSYLFVGCRFLG